MLFYVSNSEWCKVIELFLSHDIDGVIHSHVGWRTVEIAILILYLVYYREKNKQWNVFDRDTTSVVSS